MRIENTNQLFVRDIVLPWEIQPVNNGENKVYPVGESGKTKSIAKEDIRTKKAVAEYAEKPKRTISSKNMRVEYSVHEETNTIMIKIINEETNEVVKEIPPEKILDMVAKMCELAGILVDERR